MPKRTPGRERERGNVMIGNKTFLFFLLCQLRLGLCTQDPFGNQEHQMITEGKKGTKSIVLLLLW